MLELTLTVKRNDQEITLTPYQLGKMMDTLDDILAYQAEMKNVELAKEKGFRFALRSDDPRNITHAISSNGTIVRAENCDLTHIWIGLISIHQ